MKKYKTWKELKTERGTEEERRKIRKELEAERALEEKNLPSFPEKEGKNGQQD